MKKSVIFVVGGVMSGVGKGITTASIAKLIQDRGYGVTAIKMDQYINVDAGTMNPTEHGEVSVLKDGDETDQDMCSYERFLDVDLTRSNYMTTGRVYQSVIERERNLEYKGKCVEVVPHIPLEIIGRINKAIEEANADVAVIEIGGTVGEYQNILFLEAIRMMRQKGDVNVCTILVSYLPVPDKIGEMKTKPTQTASRMLNAAGLQADFIVGRSDRALDEKRKKKIAMFCNVSNKNIISAPDVDSIYTVPEVFEKQNFTNRILTFFGMDAGKYTKRAQKWNKMVEKMRTAKKSGRVAKIGIAGKYFSTGDYVLSDSYISVIEAIKHAATQESVASEIVWLDSEIYETDMKKMRKELDDLDGLIVPGGFGARGVEGKIAAIKYCREQQIPFLGICYGMQMMVTEYARNVVGLAGANTTEIDKDTKYPVIDILPDQKKKLAQKKYGGTMRLGSYPAKLLEKTLAFDLYKTEEISERHRHRYEVNPEFIEQIIGAELVFSATSPDGTLMEIAEMSKDVHPFFIGAQFHPEFQSRPLSPHPLFIGLIQASADRKK